MFMSIAGFQKLVTVSTWMFNKSQIKAVICGYSTNDLTINTTS